MTNIQKIVKWFEQNYLDGDKIQDGQMLSSKECLEALNQIRQETVEEWKKMTENIKALISSSDDWSVNSPNWQKLDDLLQIQSKKENI